MKYIVSYSGGMGSFLATKRLLETVPKKDIELVFCDTLIEDEELYQFLDETADHLDLPITRLQDGRTPWGIYVSQRFQGNSQTAPCSDFLKRKPFKKHLKKNYIDKKINHTVVLGIGIEEIERLERVEKRYDCPVIAPMCNSPWLPAGKYQEIVSDLGLNVPRLYKMGFAHNNCGGFCCRAGKDHFKMLLENMPDRYKHHEQQQENAVEMCPSIDRPFIRTVKNGEMSYLNLEEFRIEIEQGKHKEPSFDFGGCGCFLDD